ncbi:DNA polymerase III subunit alpha [Humitalea sp. 24SJ18S-53]|uniref:DNA polymerase III subunit alpha n=1 Tax=Humitalea sp. 24SJ18S-53 TaxID=3422307 RepID=UPI003D664CCC
MTAASFVHLHTHSAYSLSEGAIKADKLPTLARADGQPAVALTDSGNLFGALEFAQYAVGKGVQPIMGCQLWLARPPADQRPGLPVPPDPLILLAADSTGFSNLQRLSSLGYMGGDPSGKPALGLREICDNAAGLWVLTAGSTGPLGRLLAEGRRDAAEGMLGSLAEAFAGRCAVELHRHGTALDAAVEPGLLALADARGLPIVAANDVQFATADMHPAHDALLCIAEGTTIGARDRRRVSPEAWFKPAAMMRAAFHDLAEACDNTLAIARSCAVMAESKKPELPLCPKVRPGMSESETIAEMARQGLDLRLRDTDAPTRARYHERLTYELGVIERMGFSGYFLIVADFIQWAKQQGIPVGPGRGSGAGSVAAWALTITDLDPLRWGLLFERFLNPDRVSMPDFDIDFCQDRRDEVIQYVRREYGEDRVAQIITFGRLQARAAVKDVGRVMGMGYGQTERIATLIPNNPAKPVTLAQAIEGEPRLREMQATDEGVNSLLSTALNLEGLYRNASTHAAGIVIGRGPLIDIVPLFRDPKSDMLVTQYSMKYVEQASLVKFDFLGLKTLTVLQRCLEILAEQGVVIDLATLPETDEKTWAMLCRGDAAGVFQFESQGMRDVLRAMKPDRFEDLIAAVSLYRPGPMANIPAYCARKHGEAWDAPHPKMKEAVEETYGILVYQEQVMRIAQELAGYSLGGADLLRRAMGKKNAKEMADQRAIFSKGAVERGIPADKATEIFDLMEKFAEYGFNKSHAAAYALISWQTAWLKANHTVAFLAASMTLDLGNTDKLAVHMQEASRLGIKVLSPDVNRSGAAFRVEDHNGTQAIRFALAAVKRVGEQAMRDMVAARDAAGPFASLADFAERVDPKLLNKLQLENLARAGAFDSLEPNRARLVTGAETVLRRAQATAEERVSSQIGLFGGGGTPDPLRLPDMPDWPELERLTQEAEAIGFHLSAHPLDAYQGALKRLGVVGSAHLADRARAGVTRMKVAGTVVNVKERNTKTGSRMAWVRLSDGAGGFEVTLFSETLSRCRELLTEGTAIMVTADAKMEGETLRLTASEVEGLERAAAGVGQEMRIVLERADAMPIIRDLLAREGRGKGRVILLPRLDGPPEARLEVEVALPGLFNTGPRLAQAIKMLPGVGAVRVA